MPAAQYDLVIEQGATLLQTFRWTSSAGAGVDLTGCTAKMQIRAGYADTGAAVLLELSTTAGTIVITAASGQIDLVVPASTTTALTWVKGVYDLEVTTPLGVVSRLVQGAVSVTKEVTR